MTANDYMIAHFVVAALAGMAVGVASGSWKWGWATLMCYLALFPTIKAATFKG